MGVESSFQELTREMAGLRELLLALYVTVVEDKPLKDPVILVDELGYVTLDMRGLLEEALAAASGEYADMQQARRALARAQECFLKIEQRFARELISYERIDDLRRLGRERRGEWQAWAMSVKQSLDSCRDPIERVSGCFFRCWQDMVECGFYQTAAVRKR